MNVVLLTSDYHLTANIGVKSFLEAASKKRMSITVKGILVVAGYDLNRHTIHRMRQFIRRAGLIFSIKNIVLSIWKKAALRFSGWFIPDSRRSYFSLSELAQIYGIPYLEVADIHSDVARSFITAASPDYLVSCFLLQIVRQDILKLARYGGINCHPALVQQHRGVFTSFWTLLKNWRRSGATVHFMTEKPDEGPVVLQRHFFVHPSDSLYHINEKSAQLGGHLLVKALLKLNKRKQSLLSFRKMGHLFHMPTFQDVRAFYAAGKRLASWKDFFKI